jgi:hypothetical protein
MIVRNASHPLSISMSNEGDREMGGREREKDEEREEVRRL